MKQDLQLIHGYRSGAYAILILLILLISRSGLAQPLLTESFNYPATTLLTGANWTVRAAGTPTVAVTAGNLLQSGSIANNFGNKAHLTNTGQDLYRTFTATNANLYSSLIVNVSAAQAAGDYFYVLGNSTSPLTYGARIYIRSNGSGFSFGVLKGNTATPEYESTVRAFGDNYFLVLKYEVVTGATNDIVRLYVNPSQLSTEPATADVIFSTATGSDIAAATSLSSVNLYQGTAANAPTLDIDAIHVGTTWAGVATAQYDYSDAPLGYEQSKDGIYAPAVHSPLPGFYLGSLIADRELSPASVAPGVDNNNPNGDGADEDALVAPVTAISKGVGYSLIVPVTNPTSATKYLYGWIDFNNNGKFEATELTTATLSFTTTGLSNRTLTWSGAQTGTIPDGIEKLYLRLRLSSLPLYDFTTAASGGAALDERSIGNGAISTANAIEPGTIAPGEVEDYQLDVIRLYDFGDLPAGYENDKDGVIRPALNAHSDGLSIGSLVDVEAAALSVASTQENNQDGDNENQEADEDGLTEMISISRGVAYSVDIPVNAPTGSGTKYLYGWLDLNGDGRFQVGELTTATLSFATVGATTRTLTWSAAQTSSIPAGTKNIYIRLRLSNSILNDFTTTASGGATLDERSIGNGAVSAADAGNATAVAFGEVEDYQLRVDDYDFGDAPLVYENGTPARQIVLQTRKIGSLIDNESAGANVPAGTDNNNDNGDGADEDGLSGELPVITKGGSFSFSVPVTVSVASNVIAWIDFNNDGKFQLGEAAYTAATGASQANQAAAIGTTTKTFWFRGTQTQSIPDGVSDVHVRVRLTQAAVADNAATTPVDERSIGDGLSTGIYGTPSVGEVEDYRFAVQTSLDYGDVPVSYEQHRDNTLSVPARNLPTDDLYLGSSYVPETGASSVAADADNNGANGDGEEEDGLSAAQFFVRQGGINNYTVAVNNTTGAAATLHAWIDFNNNGRFESGEYASAAVANSATSATLSFTAAQTTAVPATASKLYMRLRLVQANTEITIGDFTSGTNSAVVDERAIADGLNTGAFTSVSIGEVEDYQLNIIKDFGDVPISYENSSPAFQSNTVVPELYLGAGLDYELADNAVASGNDNNGTNGDGTDEDAVTELETVTVGASYSLTLPVYSLSTGNKYLYAWIDFNGDGIFNGNESASLTFNPTANTTSDRTITWTSTQTQTMSPLVIANGKTYVRLRLSAVVLTNTNNSTQTLIDSRSYGAGISSGEIEDYQFLVSNLAEYGDAPLSYEANNLSANVPGRQAASASLRLGATVDTEATTLSVSTGDDNNGSNGDGADEDGITNLYPVYSNIGYRAQVSILNNTGANRTLHGWIDFNNDGRFASGEVATYTVTSGAGQQTVTLVWPATAISAAKVYLRLRVSEGTLADGASAAVDERSIADGANTGIYTTLAAGEIEDYQLTVISNYDYGDANNNGSDYELNRDNTSVPARQAISQGLYLGQLYPDAEPGKQIDTTPAKGDDVNGTTDEDGAVPGPITGGGGYTLNVTYTNNSGAARSLYGWIDLNNNGRFESTEVASIASLPNNTTNGVATLTWTLAQTNGTIPTGIGSLYLRLRVSESALVDNANALVDERAIADGATTGVLAAAAGNGEIEDYSIVVTTDLDYGDIPLSYEQPGGTALPARQISSAAIQIGGTPDAEPAPHSVTGGADNNGTNGDGEDENGIVPANHPVTVNSAYTLPVMVTNTSGAARTLYGWLDLNSNGVFDDNEMASVNVPNNSNNINVNLPWTAAQTIRAQSDKVYLRLRLADAALTNNTATTYDERAFSDGFTTGVNAGSATRGEIEDYQLTVNPVFDFGDAPVSYETNATGTSVPVRHLPASTLYLGSTYTTEIGPGSISAGANNNGTNGDGTEEDGISAVPTLSPGGSYSTTVNVFKSISGTGTIHGWMDMNGDGDFTANEYTSVAVSAATGAQTPILSWAAVPYTGAPDHTYIRLRFTTGSLTDNATTANVDERSIGDGISTGIYGTAPVNGEVEDYYVPVNSDGVATEPGCEGLGSIDPIQAAFHATMVRPASGGYLLFGEVAHGNGTSNLSTPVKIESGSNGFNFAGDLLMATLSSSSAYTYHQYFALTTAGLYAWGTRGIAVASAVTTATAMQPISLPPGISPAQVRMIDAGTSYMSNNIVGDQTDVSGSLALLTKTGEVWIRASVNAANITSEFNAVQGDGNILANNGSTDWHQVQTTEGVPLTGMVDVRTAGAVAVATDGSSFYTWGRKIYLGNGEAASTYHFATLMNQPTGFSAPASKVDLSYGTNTAASYYILDNTGVVHVLGNNDIGQLGIGSTVAQASWTTIILKNEEPDAAGNQADISKPIGTVTKISANNHDSRYGHFLLITQEKKAYHAGSNAGGGGMSGTVSPTSFYVPTAMTTNGGTTMLPGDMVYAEAGGHIGVLAKEGSDRYGYVGHTVSGSDGCNGCTNSPSEYNFDKTTSTGPLCGITAFDYGDLDDRYNLGAKASHEIKYSQASNPLKLGSVSSDSEDAPTITASGAANNADGDDTDGKGDDEDAFTGTLPAKTAGQPYTINVPLTNNTGSAASLYGFIDWNADGIFSPSETVVTSVNSSASTQTVSLTWADPGLEAGVCTGSVELSRSFVRLRLTTNALNDTPSTPEDERSYLAANDGEVEDYYLDWQPPFENFDYGNLPTSSATVVWPQASTSLRSLTLSATDRVWLGGDDSYPNTACASNEDRNGGLVINQTGNPVTGNGTLATPFTLDVSASSGLFSYAVTVNGNASTGVPVYWAIWHDVNGNGAFTDAGDIFTSGITTHGSPVTVSQPFTINTGGTNTGATNGAIRVVATAVNTTFTKEQNGTVQVPNGEVEDYYVVYENFAESLSISGSILNDGNGNTDNTVSTNGDGALDPVDGTNLEGSALYVTLVNSSNEAIATVPVGADGTYQFDNVAEGTYSLVLGTNPAGSTGADSPLPAEWDNSGEQLGTTTGGAETTPNGILAGIVVSASEGVADANFGINKKPVVDDKTAEEKPNPAGSVLSPVTFASPSDGYSGTDQEDETYPSLLTGQTITLTPGTGGDLYYDYDGPSGPDAAVQITSETPITDFDPANVFVDPTVASAATSVSFTYAVTDAAGVVSDPKTITVPFAAGLSISGSILNDGNGNTDNTVSTNGDGALDPVDGTNLEGSALYVTLVNSSNEAIATVPVSADGTYQFDNVAEGTYSLVLGTNPAGSTGADSPLPAEWDNSGEQLGTTTGGAESMPNGILAGIVVSASGGVSDANFGINKKPVVDDKTAEEKPNPAGSVLSPVTFASPSEGYSGTDQEDGTYPSLLTGQTVTLTPGTGGDLYYDYDGPSGPDAAVQITSETPITDFDPANVFVDPTVASTATSVSFTYAVTDAAGVVSDPKTITVPFAAGLSISGSILNDGNGNTDNTVSTNGDGALDPVDGTNLEGSALYVTLVNSSNEAIATVPVGADGTYQFDNVAEGTYSLVLGTNPAGSTGADSPLPAEWDNSGEQLGATTGGAESTPNGILSGVVVSASEGVSDANFGINKKPEVDDKTADEKPNPAGSVLSPVTFASPSEGYSGTDQEDGTYPSLLTGQTVTLTPGTGGDLYYDYDGPSGPDAAVQITSETPITDFDPANVFVDPTEASGTTLVTFTYAVTDASGVVSDPKTIDVPFEAALPVTLTSFEAKKGDGNSVRLDWATTEEVNSDFFDVEHSTDSKSWKALARVNANGDSNKRNTYDYLHVTPVAGVNYYRLKMVDRDATFTYSRIRSVNFDEIRAVNVYPNPVSDILFVQDLTSENVKQVLIVSNSGVIVYKSSEISANGINVKDLAVGSYTVQIVEKDGYVSTHKIFINR